MLGQARLVFAHDLAFLEARQFALILYSKILLKYITRYIYLTFLNFYIHIEFISQIKDLGD